MEKTFIQDDLVNNPYQDPMGNDAHQGLERFLNKFHQPGVPSHTFITDPDYYVLLWFHDANGNLIQCPYTHGYTPILKETSVDFAKVNGNFNSLDSVQGGGVQDGKQTHLFKDAYCLDLTPFVRQADLPEIKPAGSEKIKTLFGETSAGTFSPYASDGQNSITLQIVDTEFSILDAIFYPWMKDINSPWWYRPDKVLTEWATPYPMATLEVQRPRMRYLENAQPDETRISELYTYYTYKYIGIKPISYQAFEVNGAGRSNLLRSLTLTCDMCIVDLTGDVTGTVSGSVNIGHRTNLLFQEKENSGSDGDETKEKADKQELSSVEAESKTNKEEQIKNNKDVQQQADGDQPGEDEPDYGGRENESIQDTSMGEDVEDERDSMGDPSDQNVTGEKDVPLVDKQPHDEKHSEDVGDPNGDLADRLAEEEAMAARAQEEEWRAAEKKEEEKGWFDKVKDTVSEVGSDIMEGAKTVGGWIADGTKEAMGLAGEGVGGAVGVAKDIAEGATQLVSDTASETLKAGAGIAGKALGAASSLTSSVLGSVGDVANSLTKEGGLVDSIGGAASSLIGGVTGFLGGNDGKSGLIGSASNLAGDSLKGVGTITGSALGAVGKTASNLLGGLFGGGSSSSGKQPSASNPSSSSSTQASSSGEQSSSGVFGSLFSTFGSALKATEGLGKTAFGVVSNVASSGAKTFGITKDKGESSSGKDQKNPSETSSIFGGFIDNNLKQASTYIGDKVGQAGDYMDAVLDKGVSNISFLATGTMEQMQRATDKVRNSEFVTSNLNKAKNGIKEGIGFVGQVVDGVSQMPGMTIGTMGEIAQKITTGIWNKPTPIENYVDTVVSPGKSPSTSNMA